MDIREIEAFAQQEDIRLRASYPGLTDTEFLYAKTVKCGEELGELCQAVLASAGHQRREKDVPDPASEFADVIITAFLVAHSLGIDATSALRHKFSVIEERHSG